MLISRDDIRSNIIYGLIWIDDITSEYNLNFNFPWLISMLLGTLTVKTILTAKYVKVLWIQSTRKFNQRFRFQNTIRTMLQISEHVGQHPDMIQRRVYRASHLYSIMFIGNHYIDHHLLRLRNLLILLCIFIMWLHVSVWINLYAGG
jgi:hypothetical protein